MSKIPKATLSLKQFIIRQEVLKLYRDIMRTIRYVPDKQTQVELRDWARRDFEMNRNRDLNDELGIKMLLHHGRRSLTELQNSLELSGVHTKRN